MKRILALLLLASLFCSCAACSKSGTQEHSSGEALKTDPAEAETTIPNVDDYPIPQIPAKDYDGAIFHILGLGVGPFFPYREFSYDENSADVINDAVFKRNMTLKEKYNLEIMQEDTAEHSPGLLQFQQAVLAGSNEYQAASFSLYLMMIAAQNAQLVNLAELPYIDTSAPWYYRNIQKSLSIGGQEYLMTSYANMRIYDSSVLMYYNRNVAKELRLTGLEQTALDGKWTWDRFREYCTLYGQDLDSNGMIDERDRVGLIAHNGYILAFFVGMGGCFVEKNEENLPVYIGINEKNEKILSQLLTFLFTEPDSRHGESGKMTGYADQFVENRALFTAGNVYYQRTLLGAGADFGVLPYPKADEDQTDYYVHTHYSMSAALGVPITADDLTMCGSVLSDLIYLSYAYIYPAHVEKTMQYRYAADEAATKVLQMTFDSLTVELSTALNLRCDTTLRQLGARRMTQFVSSFEAIKSVSEETVRKYAENFSGNERTADDA